MLVNSGIVHNLFRRFSLYKFGTEGFCFSRQFYAGFLVRVLFKSTFM